MNTTTIIYNSNHSTQLNYHLLYYSFLLIYCIPFHLVVNCYSTLSWYRSFLVNFLSFLATDLLMSFFNGRTCQFNPLSYSTKSLISFLSIYIKNDSIKLNPLSAILNYKTAFCSVKKLYLTIRTPFT